METLVIKTKIRDKNLDKVRKFFQILNNRKDEVLESMQQEGITFEAAFLDVQGDDHYLVYLIKAKDIQMETVPQRK